jgi:hypothetical protein
VVDDCLGHIHGTAGRDRRVDPMKRGTRVLRFRIDMTPSGSCSLASTSKGAALPFESLAGALAFARITAADAEADIEIWMDRFCMFVHQPQGWPHCIIR